MIVPNYQKTILQELVMKKHTMQWHAVHVNLRIVGGFVLSLKLFYLSLSLLK
jgi:hypothetical protein